MNTYTVTTILGSAARVVPGFPSYIGALFQADAEAKNLIRQYGGQLDAVLIDPLENCDYRDAAWSLPLDNGQTARILVQYREAVTA